jgi:hypothetical protein
MQLPFDWSIPIAIAAGIAISAVCGLRAFLPLLGLGLAQRFGVLHLSSGAEWLGSNVGLFALAAATVFEIAGDKIPVVDHFLDMAGMVVRPAAAALAGYAVLYHLPAPWSQMLGLVISSGALAVTLAKAKARVGSSVLTLGMGNPILSVVEDGITFTVVLIAIVAPILALIGVIAVSWWIVSRFRRRAPQPVSNPT